MSHFSTLVAFIPEDSEIPDIKKEVYKKMLPFHQFGWGANLGEDEKQFIKFDDREDEFKKEYETETIECLLLEDGSYASKYDDKYKDRSTPWFESDTKWNYPQGSSLVTVPMYEMYPTFEKYMEDYHGMNERDPQMNRYGYWGNPNEQWDWYQIGGRWQGHLIRKENACGTQILGEASWTNKDQEIPGSRTDVDLARNIDWDAMYDERFEEQMHWYREFQIALKSLSDDQIDEMTEKIEQEENSEEFDIPVREVAIRRIVWRELVDKDIWIEPKDWDRFNVPTANDFALSISIHALVWAFIDLEGNWNEKGHMGWWGMSSGDKPEEFGESFWKFVRGLPEGAWVACVDCHI